MIEKDKNLDFLRGVHDNSTPNRSAGNSNVKLGQ
jgi:hypothetical protein